MCLVCASFFLLIDCVYMCVRCLVCVSVNADCGSGLKGSPLKCSYRYTLCSIAYLFVLLCFVSDALIILLCVFVLFWVCLVCVLFLFKRLLIVILFFLSVYACVLSCACFLICCKHALLFLFQKISLIV